MSPADASLIEGRSGAEVEQLNLQLLRVYLRWGVLGSLLYLEEEDRLVHQLLGVLGRLLQRRPALVRRHGPDAIANAVCFDLISMWRSLVPFWFSHTYLWHLIRRSAGGEAPSATGGLDLDSMPDEQATQPTDPDALDKALALAETFRTGLDGPERDLFDAWVRSAGRTGWKKEFALASGRSPTWVSNHLNALRETLREEHRVPHPDELVAVLHECGNPDGDPLPEETSPQHSAAEQEQEQAPRVDLAEAFCSEHALEALLKVGSGPGALCGEEVVKALGHEPPGWTDAEAGLGALLASGLAHYLRWAREVGRPRLAAWRFYRRIVSGRASLATLLGRKGDSLTPDERQLAERLAQCARPSRPPLGPRPAAVLFADLPAHLGVDRTQIDSLLLHLRAAARGPSRPLSGG